MKKQLLLFVFMGLYAIPSKAEYVHKGANDTFFVIVVCSFNNKQWYTKNLSSIFSQDYTNYRVVYTDDNSTDGTPDFVEQYIKDHNKEDKVTLVKNKERVGQLANTYNAIWGAHPRNVIIILDGDDWFSGPDVLTYLNAVYADTSVWLTYGQHRVWPSNKIGHSSQIPSKVIQNNIFRESKWAASHLRSFYAGLFHQIDVEDLKYNGEFIRYSADAAYMFPLLEMSGIHSKFISKVLYIYNRANPLNGNKKKMQLSLKMFKYVKQKKKYTPINFNDK